MAEETLQKATLLSHIYWITSRPTYGKKVLKFFVNTSYMVLLICFNTHSTIIDRGHSCEHRLSSGGYTAAHN